MSVFGASYNEILWGMSWNNLRMLSYSYNDNNKIEEDDDIEGMDMADFGRMMAKGNKDVKHK